jgi:nitrogen-specific signal transduction histidine kinase
MEIEKIALYVIDSWPYPVLFVDCDHIIRYMNKQAKYHYYTEKGYRDLIGKSLLEFHNEQSKEKIITAYEKLRNHGSEIFLGVNVKNQRMYISPVRDEAGELVGYFERFELNLYK